MTTLYLQQQIDNYEPNDNLANRKFEFDWLNFTNKDPKFWVLMGSNIN